MAITQNTYTGNGSTVLYSFTFPYLETTDVKVTVNGTTTTAYTFANATTIQFNTAPVAGAAILIYRDTNDTSLAATFYSGSAIRANDLNDNFTQNLYVTQEATNNIANAVAGQIPNGAIGTLQLADGAVINAKVTDVGSSKVTFTQSGTGAVQRTVESKLKDVISVKDFGAVGDGVVDDTIAIQAALEAAAAMFNQVSFPPAGAYYNPPIVLFPPGAYRLTNTLNVYNGLTLSGMAGVPYTVEHTRLIMDTQGGTVNLTKNILNLTRVFEGVARGNNFVTTIEDLGFWITNPGSTLIGRGGTGWTYDGTKGSHIYCSEPCIDTRIRRCNFYSSPNSAIYFNGSTTASFNVDECEFDTPSVGIRLNNCTGIWPQVNQSRFFGGLYSILTTNCSGQVQVNGCDFQQNARISISGATQLNKLTFTSNLHQGAGSQDNSLYASNVKSVVINGNYFGLSTESAIYLENVDSGTVSGNTIDSPGYNTPNSSAASAPAGIRLVGCKELSVTGNSIRAEAGATYNGFGIISSSNGGRTSRSLFSGNYVASVFTAGAHRNQNRILNVETTDSLIGNEFEAGGAQEYRIIRTKAGIQYGVPLTYQAVSGNVLIPLVDTAAARILVHIEQLSSNASMEFEVSVTRTNFGGTYSIKSVERDGTALVGNGPHTVTTGNTVTFSISGTSLQIAFSYTTDPMNYSALVLGHKL